MMRRLLLGFALGLGMLVTACAPKPVSGQPGEPACKHIQIANPAAAYCELLGYKSSIVDTPQGQAGACSFPDGTQCDEWAFLRGTCGQQHSYCAQQGNGIRNVQEGGQEYAVCTDASGKVLGTVAELSGLDYQLKCSANP